jgi:hypothetical protein
VSRPRILAKTKSAVEGRAVEEGGEEGGAFGNIQGQASLVLVRKKAGKGEGLSAKQAVKPSPNLIEGRAIAQEMHYSRER